MKNFLQRWFGIHFHTWVYFTEVEEGLEDYATDMRECSCGEVQEYFTMGTPALGMESSWMSVNE